MAESVEVTGAIFRELIDGEEVERALEPETPPEPEAVVNGFSFIRYAETTIRPLHTTTHFGTVRTGQGVISGGWVVNEERNPTVAARPRITTNGPTSTRTWTTGVRNNSEFHTIKGNFFVYYGPLS